MPEIAIRNLDMAYGRLKVVDDVTIHIRDKEFVALLGPSGCGKTTTLRLLAGFLSPTGGSIAVDGKVLSDASRTTPPEHRDMAMIFQSYAIWPHMTVAENVAFGLKLRRLSRSVLRARLDRILDAVRLSALADRYPSELSGGQQQRVSLARALVIEPKVLLLDEPLSNLDVHLRDELRQEIRRLHDMFGMTTVFVTHDQSEAMSTADRVVVMNQGRVEQVAEPYALYMAPRTRFVAGFIGKTNILSGQVSGDVVTMPGFVLRRPEGATGPVQNYSLRPEALSVRRSCTAVSPDAVCLHLKVEGRTYLGDRWDYRLRLLDSDLGLQMTAPPAELHEPGARIEVEIARNAFSPISD